MESARKEKLNEKKKAQKRAKKIKEVAHNYHHPRHAVTCVQVEQKAEEKQQEAVNNLSLREKVAQSVHTSCNIHKYYFSVQLLQKRGL